MYKFNSPEEQEDSQVNLTATADQATLEQFMMLLAEKDERLRAKEEELRAEKDKLRVEREKLRAEKEELAAEQKEHVAHLKKASALMREMEELDKLRRAAGEESMQAKRNADASSPLRRLEQVFQDNPPILRKLAECTQEKYTQQSMATASNSTQLSSDAGLMQLHPPQYATLLQFVQPQSAHADPEFVFVKDVMVKPAQFSGWKLYQHKPTGLLYCAPPTQGDPPKGVFKSCLQRWETSAFKEHLMTADSARLKINTDVYDIYSRVKNVRLNDTLEEFARGEYRIEVIKNERGTSLAFTKSVFFLLERVFKQAFGNDDVKFVIGIDEGGWDPKLSSISLIDCYYDIIYKDELLLRIIQESRAACEFPCLWQDLEDETDKAKVLSNLVDFYESNTGRTKYADKNVLMQLRLYMGIHHRCFGIVSSLNCWSFVKLEKDGTMHVSKRFMANENDPKLQMGMLEVLFRFICAAIGDQEKNAESVGVMKDRPDFVKEWVTSVFDKQKPDEPSDRKGANSKKKHGNKKNKSTSKRAASNGKPGASSSSSGGRKADLQVTGPKCWGDLEDPRRNAKDNNLTYKQHMSPLGTLEGDAVNLGAGRSGWVLRKTFDGIDMVIKLLCPRRNYDLEDESLQMFIAELENENRMYKMLETLQGDIVPRCFGLRWFGTLDIRAFVTEYVGPSLADTNGMVTFHQAESALAALKRIHEAGVVHCQADNLRNILWDESRQCAMFIDFVSGECREDFESEQSWLDAISKDEEDLRYALGLEQDESSRSSSYSSDEDEAEESLMAIAAAIYKEEMAARSSSSAAFGSRNQNEMDDDDEGDLKISSQSSHLSTSKRRKQ